MTLSGKQREIMDAYLFTDRVSSGEEERKVSLQVSRRQLRFLIQAANHFLESQCPLAERGEECAMLSWEEDVHSGAIERVCSFHCEEWIDELLSQAIPQSLSPRR